MISYDEGPWRFNYRIAGIALHEGVVLVHRAVEDAFWTFPGGRVELGETAEATLVREMQEELACDIRVVRPLWLVENFFPHTGRDYHELALYFLMEFAGDPPFSAPGPHEVMDGATRLIFQWVRNDEKTLSGLPLYPGFIPAGLQSLPVHLQHVVQYDG